MAAHAARLVFSLRLGALAHAAAGRALQSVDAIVSEGRWRASPFAADRHSLIMKKIRLGRSGKVALVDDEDYQRAVAEGPWEVAVRGNRTYARTGRRRGRKRFYMHQLVLGVPGGDHINHDGLDNRRENLRVATSQQNLRNMRPRPNSASRFKGVFRHYNKWQASIKINYRKFHLGTFVDETAAARAYDRAAAEHFGEFAYLNFPEDL